MLCPEGAATLAAYRQALADGRIGHDDEVVLFNCASGLKYEMPKAGTRSIAPSRSTTRRCEARRGLLDALLLAGLGGLLLLFLVLFHLAVVIGLVELT